MWHSISQDSFILKMIQESPRLHRFHSLFFISASIVLYIPASILTGTLLISCYNHVCVSVSPRESCKFSRVLSGIWKLLNKYPVGEQIYIWFLISLNIWSHQIREFPPLHPSFNHAFIHWVFMEPQMNAILRMRTSGEQLWHSLEKK